MKINFRFDMVALKMCVGCFQLGLLMQKQKVIIVILYQIIVREIIVIRGRIQNYRVFM